MATQSVRFNRTDPIIGARIDQPDERVIEATPNLRQASLTDAALYGGPITRAALSAMRLRGDRKHVIVDTKVNLLMPGQYPALPGWHNDGVPSGPEMNPAGSGAPNLCAQLGGAISAPRYHLLVTGEHCPTRFLRGPIDLQIDLDAGRDLYRSITAQMQERADTLDAFSAPPCTVVEWDWWTLHTATAATARGWRYLIRVTETDHIAPCVGPDQFLRTQSQVYTPIEFGW